MKRYLADLPHSCSLAEHSDVSAEQGVTEFKRRYERDKWDGRMGEQLRQERERLFPKENRKTPPPKSDEAS
jgi:hypothetical protein